MDMEQKLRKHAECMNEHISIEPMDFPKSSTTTLHRKRVKPLIAVVAAIIILGLGTVSAAGLYGIDIIALISEALSQDQAATQEQLDNGEWVWLNGDNIAVIVPESPTKIYLSDDGGDTWRESVVTGSDTGYHVGMGRWIEDAQYDRGFIQFSSERYGCLVLTTGTSMGSADARIFLTYDRGDTWQEIGNLNEIRRMVVTGAGYSSSDICFISYDIYDYYGPDIWYTTDKGETWQRLEVELPEEYQSDDNYGFTPLSPEFDGLEGVYPIKVRNFDDEENEHIIYMYSHDDGFTWSFK